jgi:protein-S-isoprenylcysteine O-methyltransferase Ste14
LAVNFLPYPFLPYPLEIARNPSRPSAGPAGRPAAHGGRYFTFTVVTSRDQPVITTGPYRFVRHPGYLALIMVLTGIGVILENWLSIAALGLIPPVGIIYRIRVEENTLSATLGDACTSYASRRKRLIPFAW